MRVVSPRPDLLHLGRYAHIFANRLVTYGAFLSTDFYYRYIYGQRFAAPLQRFVAPFEKKARGDVPIERADWERQYLDGRWAMLERLDELPRYSVLAGYAQFFYSDAAVLDVGCGEGVLALRLRGSCRRYLGIDISTTAIERARKRLIDPRFCFEQADAAGYRPTERYDLIVFNECLYYFAEPPTVFASYLSALTSNGAAAVSMYRGSERARAILRQLQRTYPMIDHTMVCNGSYSWDCCLFRPVR